MTTERAPVTMGLLIAIGLAFLAEVASGIPLWNVDQQDTIRLAELGAIIPGIFERGDYWRLLAAMFLHIGLLHLLLNSWALFQLGGVFELMFGSVRFAWVYFGTGLVASIASAINMTRSFEPLRFHSSFVPVAAGASGAIFGILGALIVAIRRSPRWRHQTWTRGLTNQLMLWAAINIVIGFTFPGIDNAAHMGGFVCGLLLGLVPHNVPPPSPGGMTIDVERDR